MPHRRSRLVRLAPLCVLLLLLASPLAGQAEEEERPRVERVTFRGVDAVETPDLRVALHTRQTRCRGVLFRPFCWVSGSPLWQEIFHLDRLELQRDELRVRVFYFQRGYREAEVETEVRPRGRGVEVVFTIEEGEPTTIERLTLHDADDVLEDRHRRRARLPDEGDPLNLVLLDSARLRLHELLWERGFLDAGVSDTIVVDDATRTAQVDVLVDAGRRATVGEIEIEGNEQIEESVIRIALDLAEGDVLRRSRVLGSQRNLYESNLFRQVRVEVPEQADSAKRIEVVVREAPLREVRAAVGLSTMDFFQTEGRFTHHNFVGGGRLLNVTGAVGNLFAGSLNGSGIFHDPVGTVSGVDERAFLQPTWQTSLTLSQPGFRSNQANTISGSLFAHRRIVPAIAIDHGFGASATFTRKIGPRSPASLNYRYELTAVEAGDIYFCLNFGVCDPILIGSLRDRRRLSPAAVSLIMDRGDNPTEPTTGFRVRFDGEHASAVTLSDFRYHRLSGEYAHYFPLGERRVLAGRIRGGWVHALGGTADALGIETDAPLLHPRKRFYAGGSRSVRGYAENQLGPRVLTVDPAALTDEERGGTCTAEEVAAGTCDPAGVAVDEFRPRPLGGDRTLEANVEYRFGFWGPLTAAVFVDAGWVGAGGTRIRTSGRAAITPGFGARYNSPVGPIRVDLGVRPRLVEELPVVTEFIDEDGERRILQLESPLRYDPLAEQGGLLRQVLRRLTLHLSIGQAF